jgi:tetratricopeptide (TPR) repeat protein
LGSFVGEFAALCVHLLDIVYFVVLPRVAHRRFRERAPERLRRYLEWVVATPSLFGSTHKLFARESLAGIYLGRGQHAEVVAHCRAGLESLSGFGRSTQLYRTLGANFRVRLADSLEALGRVDEAADERRRAQEALDLAHSDASQHHARAQLLEGQNRHEEAYAEYLKELDLTPAFDTVSRIQCMCHLLPAAHNAGRPADCLRWAEAVVALGAKGVRLRSAHRMAGVACGHLSRLEEAEQHLRDAYDSAAADNDRPAMAEIIAQLAGCLYKQGKLARANEVCGEAAALDPKAVPTSRAIQTQVLREWGRYDEALAIYGNQQKSVTFFIPRFERRIRAVRSLDRACVEAECGRVDDAWLHIQEAIDGLATDARFAFKSEAALSLVFAARGDADESQRLAAWLEPRLTAFERDPATCRSVLYDLGMAACARGDHAAGIDCWTRFLALGPSPVRQPNALYHRGECHRLLGDLGAARNDYQAAVAMNIDSHFSRLARQRLGELALL